MANINTNPSGKVLTANGIVVLNNVSDIDPRKAVVFDNRQDALNGIDAAQGYNRVENLILYYKENGKTVAGIFDGGIADENFIPFITDTSKWELLQENPYNLRVPTIAEWQQEYATWSSQDTTGAFNSILKLTKTGRRIGYNGSIYRTGDWSFYWSSTVIGGTAKETLLMTPAISTGTFVDSQGHSLRLIVEGEHTQQEFDDNYANKTIIINELSYGFVYNLNTNKIWLDRNLGATQVATSSTDANAYGDLFQWGRPSDGHEKRTSNTINVQATSPQPCHNDFIIGFNNWLTPNNDNLWQGVNGINNPALYEKLVGKNCKKTSYIDLLDKPDIKDRVITVTLNELGASDFHDNIPEKIKAYAVINNIEREDFQKHYWEIIEGSSLGNSVEILLTDSGEAVLTENGEVIIVNEL